MTSHYSDEVCIPALLAARENKNIRLGLCCINNTLRNPVRGEGMKKKPDPIFCSRSCIRDTFTVKKVKELALQNVKDLIPMLEWNQKHDIHHLRLSSEMFPHYTDKECESYTLDFAIPSLQKAGELANKLGHRITMHPAQWNQIGAKSEDVFQSTVTDLSHHADILDAMNIDHNGILCIHGGGTYGDKESTMKRWIEQFDDLPTKVKRRIAIENCEKCYSVEDVLQLSQRCDIPVIYDTHHYHCYDHYHPNESQKDIQSLIPDILDSWKTRKPLFHISEQKPNKPVGTHSDMIENIPGHLLEIPYLYSTAIDIEVEAKDKEKAIFYLMDKYKI
jgi:UV DNA damage endonuclease